MVQRKYISILLALLPLSIGGLIYICFRNENILLFYWMKIFNINYSILRQVNLDDNVITSYITYSLPNGLWILSALLLFNIFLEKKYLIIYSIVFIFISITIEISQLYGIISGTFDILDIFTILLFSSIGFAVNMNKEKNEKL